MDKILTVARAARELGCSERWLREAEKRGRIPKARRNLNGWRVYTQEDIATLQQLLIGKVFYEGDERAEKTR